MSAKRINIKDLLDYEGKEGLILQGCGGDPQEWIDGINDLLTKQEILLDGTKFNADDCAVFSNLSTLGDLFADFFDGQPGHHVRHEDFVGADIDLLGSFLTGVAVADGDGVDAFVGVLVAISGRTVEAHVLCQAHNALCKHFALDIDIQIA